jgi:hypothetical protein
VSTSEGEEHLGPDATPTPAEAAPDPLAEGGHDESAAPSGEPTAAEPTEEQPHEEAVAEEPVEKGPGFFARMTESTSPYTMLLWIALVALFAGTALLVVELARYEWDWKAKGRRSAAATLRYEAPLNTTAIV